MNDSIENELDDNSSNSPSAFGQYIGKQAPETSQPFDISQLGVTPSAPPPTPAAANKAPSKDENLQVSDSSNVNVGDATPSAPAQAAPAAPSTTSSGSSLTNTLTNIANLASVVSNIVSPGSAPAIKAPPVQNDQNAATPVPATPIPAPTPETNQPTQTPEYQITDDMLPPAEHYEDGSTEDIEERRKRGAYLKKLVDKEIDQKLPAAIQQALAQQNQTTMQQTQPIAPPQAQQPAPVAAPAPSAPAQSAPAQSPAVIQQPVIQSAAPLEPVVPLG